MTPNWALGSVTLPPLSSSGYRHFSIHAPTSINTIGRPPADIHPACACLFPRWGKPECLSHTGRSTSSTRQRPLSDRQGTAAAQSGCRIVTPPEPVCSHSRRVADADAHKAARLRSNRRCRCGSCRDRCRAVADRPAPRAGSRRGRRKGRGRGRSARSWSGVRWKVPHAGR